MLIGLFMIGFWSMLLMTDQVPSEQKPWAISFHLAGEFLTAVLLVVSGVGSLRGISWASIASRVALGMLLYTVIVSPGYYAQLNEMPMVYVFLVLVLLTVAAICLSFRSPA